jgi:putative aldouronate transport system permease protein
MADEKKTNNSTIDYDSIVIKKPSLWLRMYKYRYFYIMVLPVLIFLFILYYWPMLGIRYAFSTYKLRQITAGTGPDYSTGIANFQRLFADDFFLQALKNTLILSIVNLILAMVCSVVIALMINEIQNAWGKKIVQTVLYLPHFLSWVVVASIFTLLLSAGGDATGTDTQTVGFVNAVLIKLHIIQTPVAFLSNAKTWRGVWYFANRWKETGWGTIIYLAALSGISPDLYEAAEIDGAGRLKQTWYVTIPSIMNTILVVFILNLAKVMNVFESVFVLYNDLVYSVSDVIQCYSYRVGIVGNDYGYSTAIGLFKGIVSLILVTASDIVAKKVRGYGII